jgi:hypothetical protein
LSHAEEQIVITVAKENVGNKKFFDTKAKARNSKANKLMLQLVMG